MTTSEKHPFVAVLVAAYNEEQKIADVVNRLLEIRGNEPWEIMVVNDGSTDSTGEKLAPFADRIRVITHHGNFGYGASLKTGIRATRAENVIFIDADGQHDPTLIPTIVEKLRTFEFVIGSRQHHAGVPTIRKPGKVVLQLVVSFLVGHWIEDVNCGYRGGRRNLYLRMLDLLPDGFSFTTTSLVYVLKNRFRMTFLNVAAQPRTGKSSVKIFRDGFKTLLLALRLVTLFDPIRAFGTPAMFLIAVGVVYQIYILATRGLHIVGGSILSILGGVILFHFALLADQIASLRKEISSHSSLIEEHLERQNNKS